MTGVVTLLTSGNVVLPFRNIQVVEGNAASKTEFFEDEQVTTELMRHHLAVHMTNTSSLDIAMSDIHQFDFLFPSGQPAADMIIDGIKGSKPNVTRPFTSPVVLATFREYADALVRQNVATAVTDPQRPGTPPGTPAPVYYRLDIKRFLGLIRDEKRWRDLGIPSDNRIAAWAPSVCRANSGAAYLALAAFVWNGNDVPQDLSAAVRLAEELKPLVKVTGLPEAGLFPLYITPEGRDRPIVVIYEHQFLEHQLRYHDQNGSVDRERVLLYPSANFKSIPQFIPLTPVGERIGRLLATDENLRRRATELGYRLVEGTNSGEAHALDQHLENHGVPVPPADSGVGGTSANYPSLDLLNRMINTVGDC